MKKRKKEGKKFLDQIDLKGILEQRARFEKRIIELGGKIPKPWPGLIAQARCAICNCSNGWNNWSGSIKTKILAAMLAVMMARGRRDGSSGTKGNDLQS